MSDALPAWLDAWAERVAIIMANGADEGHAYDMARHLLPDGMTSREARRIEREWLRGREADRA